MGSKQKSKLAKSNRQPRTNSLASIEYSGIAGVTQECMDAVMRLIQFNDHISKARILTCSQEHCLLLTINIGGVVAIKSGFTSGYGGEGPSGFSYILQLLHAHGAEIDEYGVEEDLIYRIDNSCLTKTDLRKLDKARPIRPQRWSDYIQDRDWNIKDDGMLWREFPCVIPYAIIDPRIVDLAKSFWQAPDEKLLTGYRRLEDIIRARIELDEHGMKLFSRAFLGLEARLEWKNLSDGEKVGRGTLFTAAYLAFRNPRAHKELQPGLDELLAEFLLLNHLYRLEHDSHDKANNQ